MEYSQRAHALYYLGIFRSNRNGFVFVRGCVQPITAIKRKANMNIKNLIISAVLIVASLTLSACEATDAIFRIYYLDVQPAKKVPTVDQSAKESVAL